MTGSTLRIVRPYDTEEAFLASELETLGKTGVLLVGAEPRATGTIVRFEIQLTGGAPLLRGEGRVLAFKERAFRGESALALRFTRLDARSKELLDRAISLRGPKGRSMPPVAGASVPPPSASPSGPPSGASPLTLPPEALRDAGNDTHAATLPPAPAGTIGPEPPRDTTDATDATDATLPPSPVHAEPSSSRSTASATDREALLARLRARAAALPPERIEELLAAASRHRAS